jgi:hypothetical protein
LFLHFLTKLCFRLALPLLIVWGSNSFHLICFTA